MNVDLIKDVTHLSVFGIGLEIIGTIALMLIMITTGLTLQFAHFKPLFTTPKPIYFGLFSQLIALPAVAFGLVSIFEPGMYIAMGLILLSCCPGGATSNFFTLLAKGNVATSVCLTVLSGIVSVFSIPLIVNLALSMYAQSDQTIFLPVAESMLRIFVLVVLPVMIGMSLKHKFPSACSAIEPSATKFSFVMVLLTMVVVLQKVWPIIPELIREAGLITLLLNVSMMLFGFLGAKALRLKEKDARCISIETGVQNYLLSVVLAIGLLQEPMFAVVPLLYLFIMYITVFSFIAYCRSYRSRYLPLTPPHVIKLSTLKG